MGASVHAVAIELAKDNLDGALEAGLLTCQPCGSCTPGCTAALLDARDARREALAARERFRAREARLARRRQARATRRGTPTEPGSDAAAPALPAAAAAALARAKARVAGPRNE